ncbi:DUF5336 domain-containing protein [Rhodococcus sp. NPDC003318]|uniref:DUF5336 domain-containing protein n=1 Tax=Rhodococcus sp. NPDC003318 TaxID=3364503 RepID=UPI0036938D61
MTYPPTGPGYPSAGPAGAPGPAGVPGPSLPPAPPASPQADSGSLPRLLCLPVLVLGILNFLLGFAPYAKVSAFGQEGLSQNAFEGGYPVVALAMLLLGGLLAGLSLFPGQAHQPTAAATSLVGFVVSLFFLFTLSEGVSLAWGGILVLVLAFIQAAIAIAVLLFGLGLVRAPAPRPSGYPQQFGPPAPGYGPSYPAAYGQAPPGQGYGQPYPGSWSQQPQTGYGPTPNPYAPPQPQPQPYTPPQEPYSQYGQGYGQPQHAYGQPTGPDASGETPTDDTPAAPTQAFEPPQAYDAGRPEHTAKPDRTDD